MITPPDPNYLIIKPSPKQESVKEKRIDSAKLNREKNESSKKVFPQPTSDKTKERYRSIYNKDFEGSYTTPLEPRPTSPTRRNNPHPSQVLCIHIICIMHACMHVYMLLVLNMYYSNLWYGGCQQERLGHSS